MEVKENVISKPCHRELVKNWGEKLQLLGVDVKWHLDGGFTVRPRRIVKKKIKR